VREEMDSLIKTVLIVGLGSIGKRHARTVRSIFPDVNIVVLRHKKCDDDDIKALGLYKCVTSIDEALKLNPKAAIISNPASKHIEIAKILANKNVNLLIEKPISDSSKGVQELIDICYKNKIILMTGYNLRFLPSLIEFRKQVHLGKVGKIYSVRAEIGQYLPSWRPETDYKEGVSAQKSLGGGALLELSHEIDYLSWVFGRVSWVKAHISKQSDLKIDVEDSAYVILGFEEINGATLTASLNIDFIRHDATRRCFVIGEKGTISWDGIKGEVKFFEKCGKHWKILFSFNSDRDFTYIEEIKSFFLSIETNTKVHITGEAGLQAVNIIENIKQSSSENSIIFCQR
jgi:predicted dehydrogenase